MSAQNEGGRFAPSPTGPLHLGSLYAALASFLDARANGYAWRVRMDDLDTPRNAPDAESKILRTLEAHHLHWDGSVERQSERIATYDQALDELSAHNLLFFCTCSRRQLASNAPYPGTCRERRTPIDDAAIRVLTDEYAYRFDDLVVGEVSTRLDRTTGDFIVKRRDGIIAYQLATAYDDGQPDITRVIRGADLLSNTPRQLHLMRLLNLSPPTYGHVPVLINPAGDKLSKQTKARAVDDARVADNLRICLKLLGLDPPTDGHEVDDLLAEAARQWNLDRIGRTPHSVED